VTFDLLSRTEEQRDERKGRRSVKPEGKDGDEEMEVDGKRTLNASGMDLITGESNLGFLRTLSSPSTFSFSLSLPGWSNRKEEGKAIHIFRPSSASYTTTRVERHRWSAYIQVEEDERERR
jgi:hypothetical protein